MNPLTTEERLTNENLLLRRQILQNAVESFVGSVAAARGVPAHELVIHVDGRLERNTPPAPPVPADTAKRKRKSAQ